MRRRRSTLDNTSPGEGLLAGIRRGSSSFSDFSLNDARKDLGASADDLFNPSSIGLQSHNKRQASHYLPIVFALLPALAGIFFDNGASFFTDLILLSLAAIVLHWSVTQPWDWYLETQQVSVANEEFVSPPVLETDSDLDPTPSPSPKTVPKDLGDIAENIETTGEEKHERVGNGKEPAHTPFKRPQRRTSGKWEAQRAAAAKELRIHEILALIWCFVFPILSSYLLHTIRSQLSRPSEGLVSDYNLTIFLCAAELRPVSHLIKMVRNRTLRVQRIVSSNPYENQTASSEELVALSSRLDDLEARTATLLDGPNKGEAGMLNPRMNQADRAREISNTMQPEMDAMNRAMRRYEKKIAVLAGQMDGKLEYLDRRLQDAVALAAVAAKNSSSQSLFAWSVERTAAALMLPVHAIVAVFTFPFRTMSTLIRGSKSPPPEKARKSGNRDRAAGATAQGRETPNRIPSRLSRR